MTGRARAPPTGACGRSGSPAGRRRARRARPAQRRARARRCWSRSTARSAARLLEAMADGRAAADRRRWSRSRSRTRPARDARACLGAYFAELDARFDAGFDPGAQHPAGAGDSCAPAGLLLRRPAATASRSAAAALKLHDDGAGGDQADVGRAGRAAVSASDGACWASSSAQAGEHGAARHPAGDEPEPAARRSSCTGRPGYVEVAPFNDEPYAHHWFEKELRRD